MKFKPQKRINRAAVAKSLRDLTLLFGKGLTEPKGNPTFARGVSEAVQPVCKASKMSSNSNAPGNQRQPLTTIKGVGE